MPFYFPGCPAGRHLSVSVGVRSTTETAIFDLKDGVTQFEVANPAVRPAGYGLPST